MTQFFDKRTKWEKFEDFVNRFVTRTMLFLQLFIILALMGLACAFIYLVVRGMML